MIYRNDSDIESALPEDEPRIRFRAAHVFDLSQTDGEPLPHPAEVGGDPRDFTKRLKANRRQEYRSRILNRSGQRGRRFVWRQNQNTPGIPRFGILRVGSRTRA